MSVNARIQRNFAGGLVGRSMLYRHDHVANQTGLATAENLIVTRAGALLNRPGGELNPNDVPAGTTANAVEIVWPIDDSLRFLLLVDTDGSDGIVSLHQITSGDDISAALVTRGIIGLTPSVLAKGISYAQNGAELYMAFDGVRPVVARIEDGPIYYLEDLTVGSTVEAPQQPVSIVGKAGADSLTYSVAAYYYDTQTESLPSPPLTVSSITEPDATDDTTKVTITWTSVDGADEYIIYRHIDDIASYLSTTGADANSFVDIGQQPDSTDRPRAEVDPTGAIPLAVPPGAVTNISGTAGVAWLAYYATAYYDGQEAESAPGGSKTSLNIQHPTAGNPVTVTWDAAPSADRYLLYRNTGSGYEYAGTTTGTSLVDDGSPGDESTRPRDVVRWPSVVGYQQQRLVLAAPPGERRKITWGVTGNPREFTSKVGGIRSSDAFALELQAAYGSNVQHVIEASKLAILTKNALNEVSGDLGGALAADGFPQLSPLSHHGAARTPAPIVTDEAIIYMDDQRSIVRRFAFNGALAGVAEDLTILTPELFDGHHIVSWAYQASPDGILWCVRDDGLLLSFTHSATEGIRAWMPHPMAGTVETVFVAAGATRDLVFLRVAHSLIDGVNRSWLRLAERHFNANDYQKVGIFSDFSQVATDLAAPILGACEPADANAGEVVSFFSSESLTPGMVLLTESISDDLPRVVLEVLAHVGGSEYTAKTSGGYGDRGDVDFTRAITSVSVPFTDGTEVIAVCDGLPYVELAQGGTVTVPPCAWCIAGIRCESIGQTIPPDSLERTAVGNAKHLKAATLCLANSIAVEAGPTRDDLAFSRDRGSEQAMDSAPPLVNGEQRFNVKRTTTAKDGSLWFAQRSALPFTLLAAVTELDMDIVKGRVNR